MATALKASEDWAYHEDVEWLRATALHRLLLTGIGTGLLWFFVMASWLEVISLAAWSGATALVGLCLLAWAAERWFGLMPAACIYVVAVGAGVLLAAWAYANPWLLSLLALAVGAAGLLISPAAGFVAAGVAAGGLLAASQLLATPAISFQQATVAAISIVFMAILLWVAMYPLRMTLHWSWASYQRSQQQTAALRDRRGKLAATLKDLDAAYSRLENMAVELERARRAADEARRLKAEFAASVSHELRTPLNLIVGFSEMMAMSPRSYGGQALPPAYRMDMQAVFYNAQHLSDLIDDVLDLSQIEAGRMGLFKEPVALGEVIEEAMAGVVRLFEGKDLSLAADVPDDLPIVEADRTRVRQVLTNLLNNAARFTECGGVTISASADSRDVTISVADSGVGIAEEDLPRVFERFRQLHGPVQRQGGSGLGLSISKRFVELHGGRMWLTSKLGEGTTFYFTLPLREELGIRYLPSTWETWARPAPSRDGQRAVVVVDSDLATAHLLQRYLQGYRVLPAADANEARRLASQGSVHALLATAPATSAGWLQLREVRQALPGLPVAVCTLQGGARVAEPRGVANYLVKPVTQERFLHALADLGERVRSLLIVDDDPEVVRLLSRMALLAPRPYRVARAFGGAEALEIMARRPPGAVVLDLLMPDLDGYVVLQRMQAEERLRDVPVIVVTAKGREDEAITAELVGITRQDGLPVGEMVRCLKASLDALQPPGPLYSGSES